MPSTDKVVRVFFAGDFCSKPSTSRISVSDELRSLIHSCDLKVVNFEVPLRPAGIQLPPQKQERFFQHDDVPDFLKGLGFNLFQLANNHAFDWEEAGFMKTKDALGDSSFGAGTYDEALRIKVAEVGKMKIGFLALTFAAYKGVFDEFTGHDGLGCAYLYDLRVNHIILQAKKEVDYLFVLPHDGIEYIDIPLPATIARYRDFIDYGADGVIGTHPHCPQGWEEYKGKPIFYSLGNFLFNSKEGYDYRATNRPHWYEGLCAILSLKEDGLSWEVVNTRNVDNVGIEIDHGQARDEHNLKICRLINDKEAYNRYLDSLCAGMGRKELTIVDTTFHCHSLKKSTKVLLNRWKDKLRGNDPTNDYPLQRLLTHDARRNLLMLTLKRNYSEKSSKKACDEGVEADGVKQE